MFQIGESLGSDFGIRNEECNEDNPWDGSCISQWEVYSFYSDEHGIVETWNEDKTLNLKCKGKMYLAVVNSTFKQYKKQ